jgi:hypothetical protein
VVLSSGAADNVTIFQPINSDDWQKGGV